MIKINTKYRKTIYTSRCFKEEFYPKRKTNPEQKSETCKNFVVFHCWPSLIGIQK